MGCFHDSRSLRSLVPVVVGLRKALQSSDGFLLKYFLNGALTLSRPAHGQYALTYACGNDALIAMACTSCRRH